MKSVICVIVALVPAIEVAHAQQVAADSSNWRVFRNAKYGYEISVPNGFDVWPTGPAGERDGRAIRIGRREFAAAVPVLDIRVHPRALTIESPVDVGFPDMDVTVDRVVIGGDRATEVTYRWKATGDIVFVNLYHREALIEFHAQPGLHDAHGTVWWRIIASFRKTRQQMPPQGDADGK